MSGYTCIKCGETASSKCAIQRSVFPNDQLATIVGNNIKVETARMGAVDDRFRRDSDSDIWQTRYTITLKYTRAPDWKSAQADGEKDLINMLEALVREGGLRRAFCDHDWQIDAGQTCMFGCCKS